MKRIFFVIFALGLAVFAPMSGPVLADSHSVSQAEMDAAQDCPQSSRDSERLICACTAGAATGSVWGSGPYTGDSALCAAAAHAGALEAGVGMIVKVPRGAQDSFQGSSANGVTSSNWGAYGSSFDVVRAQVQIAATPSRVEVSSADLAAAQVCPDTLPIEKTTLLCSCPANPATRSVWGSSPFTADSDICTAAIHAAAVGAQGGMVVVSVTEGQDSYWGSDANGVTSRDWGSYGRSITLATAVVAGMDAPDTSTLEACSRLPTGLDSYSCTCPADDGARRSIYGAGPYTSDSDICTAARHDGAVPREGGVVTVLRIGGLDSYQARERNGITPSAWGSYSSSMVFDRNATN